MSDEVLTPQQRRTLKAREALAATFPTTEAKAEYYRDLAEREAARRRGGIVLSAEEASALAHAFDLIRSVAERARKGGQGA